MNKRNVDIYIMKFGETDLKACCFKKKIFFIKKITQAVPGEKNTRILMVKIYVL